MPLPSVRLLILTMAVVLLAGAGCSNDDDATSNEPDEGATYALLRSDDWTLQEAVDPPSDDPMAAADRPPLAWYAEYVQESASSSRMVRISGHLASLSSSRAELEELGFTFDEVDVERWEAVGSAAADGSPAILLLDNGGSTIMGLSYEVGLEELADLAAAIHTVDRATWVEAGGVVR